MEKIDREKYLDCLNLIIDRLLAHDEAYHGENIKKPSITSELEAGLYMNDGEWCEKRDNDPCTYILLPEQTYYAFLREKPDTEPVFHDIPVYGLPIDKVVYGTEEI